MEPIWYALVAGMLTAYVLLDGFDLGAGALHLLARSEQERTMLVRSIGPVWDGNEVWLLAAGGTLLYAFPLLYASSFSGFYLSLMIVLWLLVLRAIGLEFRMHLEGTLWREFFDTIFALSSAMLAVFFGAALGNVLRGVPLEPDHYFFLPLWTNFRPRGPRPGILDWYTVLAALAALLALMLHGSLWVALKTQGELNLRMRRISGRLLPAVALLTVLGVPATMWVRPAVLANYQTKPMGWVIPAAVATSLFGIWRFRRAGQERNAFLCSCAYLIAMLTGAAFAMYPTLLPASGDRANSLTIYNAAAGPASLAIGLGWWSVGILIAICYFVFVYRFFRGKVAEAPDGHGY